MYWRVRAALVALLLTSFVAGSVAAAADEARPWTITSNGTAHAWTYLDLFADGSAYASLGTKLIYESGDSGTTWAPKPAPTDLREVTRMSFASSDVGVVAGYTDAGPVALFRTADGAETWKALPELPNARQRSFVDGLEAVPGTRSVIASSWTVEGGGCDQRRADHRVWHLRGGQWEETVLPYPASIYEIEFFDTNNGLVLAHKFERVDGGNDCNYALRTARSFVLLTRDGGRSFEKIHSAVFIDESPVKAVAMPAPHKIILGREDGSILVSTNGGRDFSHPRGLRVAGGELDALTFPTAKIGYAGTNGTGLWRTNDGGRTWTLEPSPFESTELDENAFRGSIAAVGTHRAIASGPGAIATREP